MQVFGGPQAAGLDLALDVFGTLSVTMEDLPKDGAAAPVDDASDQIILPVRFSPASKHDQHMCGVAVVDQRLKWHHPGVEADPPECCATGCRQPAGFLQQQLQQSGAQRAPPASTL